MPCEIYFLFASGLIKEIESEIIPKNHKSTIVIQVQFDQIAQQSKRNISKTQAAKKMGDRFIFLAFSTRINHGQKTKIEHKDKLLAAHYCLKKYIITRITKLRMP